MPSAERVLIKTLCPFNLHLQKPRLEKFPRFFCPRGTSIHRNVSGSFPQVKTYLGGKHSFSATLPFLVLPHHFLLYPTSPSLRPLSRTEQGWPARVRDSGGAMPHLVRIFPAVWAFTEQAVWRGAGARRSVAQGRPQGAGAMAQQKGIEDSAMGNKPGSMGPVISPMVRLQDLTLCWAGEHSEPLRKSVRLGSWQNWINCAFCTTEKSQRGGRNPSPE